MRINIRRRRGNTHKGFAVAGFRDQDRHRHLIAQAQSGPLFQRLPEVADTVHLFRVVDEPRLVIDEMREFLDLVDVVGVKQRRDNPAGNNGVLIIGQNLLRRFVLEDNQITALHVEITGMRGRPGFGNLITALTGLAVAHCGVFFNIIQIKTYGRTIGRLIIVFGQVVPDIDMTVGEHFIVSQQRHDRRGY